MTRAHRVKLLAPCLSLVFVVLLRAGPATAGNMDAGNEAYLRGEWTRAVEHYEGLVSSGFDDPSLYYNLGNAYMRVGELGRARYNYRRALERDPGAEDLRHNIQLLERVYEERGIRLIRGEHRGPWWQGLGSIASARALELLALLASLLFFGALALRRVSGRGFRRAALGVTMGAAVVAGIAAAGLRGAQLALEARHSSAMVLDDRCPLREGPREDSRRRAELRGGQGIERLEDRGEWSLVRLPNGLEGWIESSSIGRL